MIEPRYARNDSLREFSAIANELKHSNFSTPQRSPWRQEEKQ